MLQPADSSQKFSPNTFSPTKTAINTSEQATIGRSLIIKGEVRGDESIYIDGRIEGSIHFAEHRVTVGRNGSVAANITAREVVVMGTVKGNIQCLDRVEIRAEGSLTGDVVTQRISVEDGAMLKGSVQIRTVEAGKGAEAKTSEVKTTDAKSFRPKEDPANSIEASRG